MAITRRGAAHAALIVFSLTSANASGVISGVFSQSALSAYATLESSGVMDDGDNIFDLFTLSTIGSMDESRVSTAMIPSADANAFARATSSISFGADEVTLSLDLATNAGYDAGANDTFAQVRSRSAHFTRFTTDRRVRVTLSYEATFDFDLNFLTTPILPQTEMGLLIDNVNELIPVFAMQRFDGSDEMVFELEAGTYHIRGASDNTLETFGFPSGVYTGESSLLLNAHIVTIPSAGTSAGLAALLGLCGARRRR